MAQGKWLGYTKGGIASSPKTKTEKLTGEVASLRSLALLRLRSTVRERLWVVNRSLTSKQHNGTIPGNAFTALQCEAPSDHEAHTHKSGTHPPTPLP